MSVLEPVPPLRPTCETKGCTRPARAKGRCVTCYHRQRQADRVALGHVCMVPGCDKPEKSRGCCAAHYKAFCRAVAADDTTWRSLVQAGKVLRKKPQGRAPRVGRRNGGRRAF